MAGIQPGLEIASCVSSRGPILPSCTLVSALKTKVVTPVHISLYPKLYVANHGGNVLLLPLLLSHFSHVRLCATP